MNCVPPAATSFRYKQLRWFCLWTIVVDVLVLMVVVGLVRTQRVADAALFGLLFFGCFSLIGWFLVSSMADLVVSDSGLSRRLWGHTLREISWENVRKVRVFARYHRGYAKKVRVFHVLPARPSRFRFTPSGKIWFNEPADLSALIEHMNRYIAAYRIPVEVQVGPSWGDPSSWSTRNRIEPVPRATS